MSKIIHNVHNIRIIYVYYTYTLHVSPWPNTSAAAKKNSSHR